MIKNTLAVVRDFVFKQCVTLANTSKNQNKKKIIGFITGTKTGVTGSSKILFEALKKDSRFFVYWIYQNYSGNKNFVDVNDNAYYRRAFTKIGLFRRTNLWVTTHGSFGIPIDYEKYNQKRLELWHGNIAFKGCVQENKERIAKEFNRSTTVVVSSPYIKKIYSDEWNVKKEVMKDLGQPRTDKLINKKDTNKENKKKLGIKQEKVVLYAPTHEQDGDGNKLLFPWDSDATFQSLLEGLGENSAILIRPHPYWKKNISEFINDKIENDERVYYMPSEIINDTEELLYISDALITDWSSIYFDFLLLDKPTIFLDLPNPFKDNFLLKPKERIGYLSANRNELKIHVNESLHDLEQYNKSYEKDIKRLKEKVYSKLDGKSTERCINEIIELVN